MENYEIMGKTRNPNFFYVKSLMEDYAYKTNPNFYAQMEN
jgi:hypothetical protein